MTGLPPREDALSLLPAEGETSLKSPTVGFFSSCPKTDAIMAGWTATWPSHHTTANAKPKRSQDAKSENEGLLAGTFAHRIIAVRSMLCFASQLRFKVSARIPPG